MVQQRTPHFYCDAKVDDSIFSAALLAVTEVIKATEKFPTWPTDPLHALGILGEEFGELTKATLQTVYEPHKSSIADVRLEAIQTAAMSLRFLMSLDKYAFSRSDQHSQYEGGAV